MGKFVTRELADLAKSAGFDQPCMAYFRGEDLLLSMFNSPVNYNAQGNSLAVAQGELIVYVSAPLYQELWLWLIEKRGIFVQVAPSVKGEPDSKWDWGYTVYPSEYPNHILSMSLNFTDMPTAWAEGLKAALEIFDGYALEDKNENTQEYLKGIKQAKFINKEKA